MISIKSFILVLFLLCFSILPAQNNENSLSDEAGKYFDAGDFSNAQDVYKKLLDIKPNNIIYNAKYGVCLLNTDTNKSSCIRYLYFAATQPETSPLAIFYLAKAFHLNNKFDDAITYFQKFRILVTEKDVVKYDIDRQMEMCRNGKALMNRPVEIDIFSKKSVSREFFTSAYDLLLNEAKIYSVPNDFKTDLDVSEKFNTVMCLYNQENEAVYSSYGKTLKNGKDLCRKVKFSKEWSKARSLEEINTVYDEDFPFIVADGNLLFFSSKGHNSMGGYDIFKSVWSQENRAWSKPENLGFPINSPFDDMLFIPDKETESAYFASDRNSPIGKIEIFKIKYPKELGSLSIIKGKFQVGNSTGTNKAQITVIDVIADKLEGIFNSNEKTGNYVLTLTPGSKYKFIIRSKGFAEHSFIMDVPVQEGKFVLKQIIQAEKHFQVETITAYNFFKEEEAEIISDKLLEALSEANPSPEFTDILDRHNNVSMSEIYLEKNKEESSVEIVQLAHKKGGKKTKADNAIDEAFQSFEKKKQADADNAFKLGDFSSGLKLFSELLTNSPENPDNNFKFGVCIFNADKDKTKAIPYFQAASKSSKTSPEVYYYLARIHHLNKQYNEAIANYEKFSKISSSSEIKKLKIDRRIENCINGKTISAIPPVIEIINQKTISSEGVHQSFSMHEFSGKILLTPDDFKSEFDKKNNFKSTMYLTFDNNELYYSSYGTDGKNGKDIYKRVKLSSGQWGQPQYLEGINTSLDEDFPFIAPTGTIYFSSHGHNSIGGYDIFSSEWNPSTQSWSAPQNLGFPVNSPADDIYFIRCKDGESVYFSTDRAVLSGQMEIINARIIKN